MQCSKVHVVSAFAVGITGLFLFAMPHGDGRTQSVLGPHECNDTALAILSAVEKEATADYWIKIANCLNDPDGSFSTCEQEAAAELQEDLDFAQEQYQARLEVCAELGGGPYDPQIDPTEFSTTVDNPYSPLLTGRTLVYQEQTDEGLEVVEVRALQDIVDIDGFKVRQVRETLRRDGELVEDTIDFFAQRSNGDVYYFGEVSKSYEDGFLDSLEGSWRTGKDSAKPGIVMLAHPAPGDFYRQEFLVNEAEDVARVVSIDETVTVPYGTFTHCIQTEEFSPIEPGAVEWKYYAKGIGLVLEFTPSTGGRAELVKIR